MNMESSISLNSEGKITTITIANGKTGTILQPTIHITEKCNYKCGHCYVSSGPNVDTKLSKDESFKIADQISEHPTSGILFTGGEPFLHPDIEEIITYFTDKNIKPISIFTNGSWVSTKKQTVTRLEELKELGCDHIKFSVNDNYHREFLKLNQLKIIYSIFNEGKEKNFPALETNSSKDEVNPQGNALSLPKKQLKIYDEFYKESYKEWDNFTFSTCELVNPTSRFKISRHLLIRASGEVYPCSWFVKSLGNIKTTSLNKIIDNFYNDKDYNTITEKGPQGIARQRGMDEKEIYQRFLENHCKFCYELYN